MNRMKRWLAFAWLGVFVASCGVFNIRVEDPMAYPATAGQNAAVYFVLQNATLSDDWLLGASTPVAASVEIHRSVLIHDDDREVIEKQGGEYNYSSSAEDEGAKSELAAQEVQMDMATLDSVWIAAGRRIEFEPAYYHLMLVGLRLDLKSGDEFPLILHFKNYGDIDVVVTVESN